MIAVQILLIVAILAVMGWLLIRRSTRTRAIWTLLGFVFTVFAIVAVLFPNATNVLAHLVGVGRGADLLLYCLVVVVLVMVVQEGLHRQDDQRRFAKVVRVEVLLRADIERPEDQVPLDDEPGTPPIARSESD